MGGFDSLSLDTLIEGMGGMDGFGCAEKATLGRSLVGSLLGTADFSSFMTTVRSLSLLKLTIGRPGLSVTRLGVGSFGLLSLRLMLVAARMSSPRISLPSFMGMSSLLFVGLSSFLVYPGFRDCVGGFRWISTLSRYGLWVENGVFGLYSEFLLGFNGLEAGDLCSIPLMDALLLLTREKGFLKWTDPKGDAVRVGGTTGVWVSFEAGIAPADVGSLVLPLLNKRRGEGITFDFA